MTEATPLEPLKKLAEVELTVTAFDLQRMTDVIQTNNTVIENMANVVISHQELLKAVQLAYRKVGLFDDRVSRKELEEKLHQVLMDAMGPTPFVRWQAQITGELE